MKYLSLTIPGLKGTPIDVPTGLPVGTPTGGLFDKGQNIIGVGINLAIVMAIILSVFYFVWGGLSIVLSRGDKEKMQKARARITYSIVGLFVIFLSFLLVNIIGGVLGISFFKNTITP